jgi:hypothetical protein
MAKAHPRARDRAGRFTRDSLRPYPSLVGNRYGNLLVLRFAGIEPRADGLARMWQIKCKCGRIIYLSTNKLQSESARKNRGAGGKYRVCCPQCPIAKRRAIAVGHAHRKHGHCRVRNGVRHNSPTWSSWRSMNLRCKDVKNKCYGGRVPIPVTVCLRWQGPRGFENFLEDMGTRKKGKTLDRYPDPNGNYEPGNVRWATASQQNRNKSESLTSIAKRAWATRRKNEKQSVGFTNL